MADSEGKKERFILYSDIKMKAFVPETPFLKGHIIVKPVDDKKSIQEIEEKEFLHLMYGASFAATALFENLQAHGTNIIMDTGSLLKPGRIIHADVLARFEDDGKDLLWKPKKFSEGEMKEVQERIKDKTDMMDIEKKKEIIDMDNKEVKKVEQVLGEKKKPEPEKKENEPNNEKKEEPEEESYLVKQLRRLP